MPYPATGLGLPTIPGVEELTPIGRGGFAAVYKGWQPGLRRNVAVKVLDAAATEHGAGSRFEREVMAMGALSDHPNVVPVFETGTIDDRFYLVMPLLAGGTLEDRLTVDPLPPDEVATVGRGVACALAAAHASGVLHRDVKPANILLDGYGTARLADFGIARFVDNTATGRGMLTATIAYAAPEVLAGEPATEASDVYSLGAALHAACTGRPPFERVEDESPIAFAVRVMATDPPDLTEVGVPPALAGAIHRAMARDPAARFTSATDLADALAAVESTAATAPPAAVVPSPTAVHPPVADPPVATPTVAAPTVAAPTVAGPAVLPPPVVVPEAVGVDRVVTAPAPRADGVDRRPLAVLAGLVVLAAIALGVAMATRGDGEDLATAAIATESTTASSLPPTTAAVITPTTTEPPTTVSAAPPETAGPAAGPPATRPAAQPTPAAAPPAAPAAGPAAGEAPRPPEARAEAAAEAVRSYYALLSEGRIDDGFARLSPQYQRRTGEAGYREFWSGIASVEVLDVVGGNRRADATLRYTRTDGSTSTEDVTLRFVEDPETGQLLIDDYRVR